MHIYKEDLVLNNLQRVICHKTKLSFEKKYIRGAFNKFADFFRMGI